MYKVATLDRVQPQLTGIHSGRVQAHLRKREKATSSLELQDTCSAAKIR